MLQTLIAASLRLAIQHINLHVTFQKCADQITHLSIYGAVSVFLSGQCKIVSEPYTPNTLYLRAENLNSHKAFKFVYVIDLLLLTLETKSGRDSRNDSSMELLAFCFCLYLVRFTGNRFQEKICIGGNCIQELQ